MRDKWPKRPPRASLSKVHYVPLDLRWPKGCCYSTSDDLSCSSTTCLRLLLQVYSIKKQKYISKTIQKRNHYFCNYRVFGYLWLLSVPCPHWFNHFAYRTRCACLEKLSSFTDLFQNATTRINQYFQSMSPQHCLHALSKWIKISCFSVTY